MRKMMILNSFCIISTIILIGSCSNEILNLSKGKADTFDYSSYRYEQITYLDLSENDLDEIPSYVFDLKKLERLNLSKNNLISIPPDISNLENLKLLNLSENRLEDVFESVQELKNLRLLNLLDNPIPFESYEAGKCYVNDSCLILISTDLIEYPAYCIE